MSPLVSRILLAICVFPLGTLVYLVTYFCADQAIDASTGFDWLIAGAVAWAFTAIYWSILWHKIVRSTPKRRAGAWVAAVAAILISGLIAGLLAIMDRDFGFFIGSITAPLLWLVGTVFVWKET